MVSFSNSNIIGQKNNDIYFRRFLLEVRGKYKSRWWSYISCIISVVRNINITKGNANAKSYVGGAGGMQKQHVHPESKTKKEQSRVEYGRGRGKKKVGWSGWEQKNKDRGREREKLQSGYPVCITIQSYLRGIGIGLQVYYTDVLFKHSYLKHPQHLTEHLTSEIHIDQEV